MNQVVPGFELLVRVESVFFKEGNGRQSVGLVIMLRPYCLQQWFGLFDPGMEQAFYESTVLQRFAEVDLGIAGAPDETTILRFLHLLKKHDLCGQMLDTVNRYLETKGIRIRTDTIVDATVVLRGAKPYIDVDNRETVVYSVATSAASVADKHMLPDL